MCAKRRDSNPFFFPNAGKKKSLTGKRKGRPRGISNFPLGNPLEATKKGACAPPLLDLPPGRIIELRLFFRWCVCRGRCPHRPTSIYLHFTRADVHPQGVGRIRNAPYVADGCARHPPLQDAAKSRTLADSVVRTYGVQWHSPVKKRPQTFICGRVFRLILENYFSALIAACAAARRAMGTRNGLQET